MQTHFLALTNVQVQLVYNGGYDPTVQMLETLTHR